VLLPRSGYGWFKMTGLMEGILDACSEVDGREFPLLVARGPAAASVPRSALKIGFLSYAA
jgi:hypothetical protein